MQDLSLYIHIPFCESKCYYCSFVSFKKTKKDKEKYIQYLLKEIKLNKNKNTIVKTIFIGGGTPSCLNKGDVNKIIEEIRENFVVDNNAEITIEINPNTFTSEKAQEYKNCGINRLSFGLQSANNKILKEINRIHTKQDFINAIKLAKKYGFNNINADILIGLPNQRLDDVKETLKLLKKLKIKHISCYSLILEENTKLYNLVQDKKLVLPDEDDVVKQYDYVKKFLCKNKIFRYEVSNFAKKGKECLHNLRYWNLDNYLGLGLNSHSKIDNVRFENYEDFTNYYNSLDNNKKPIKNSYDLTLSMQKEEFIMLKLRTTKGINLQEFSDKFNEDLLKIKNKEISFLKKSGFIKIKKNNLFATDKGFKILNQIILELI